MTTETKPAYEGWSIIELMGHRKLGGYVREAVVAGSAFVRVDVPGDGVVPDATQFYAPSAVYCITPTTEDVARRLAQSCRPQPVARWELPPASEPMRVVGDPSDEDDGDIVDDDDLPRW